MLFLFRNKKVSRVFASTLSLVVFTQVFAPAAAWALTAGPTSPEFSSFEPVDATDMVNLSTGDLTYNIPLIEVPGPEGGYPLSLSYHAGITPGEEASWVGLGWTLNPGAISRTVNFYPDDINGAARHVHDNWSGGNRTTVSLGLGYQGYGINMDIAKDSYKGVATGVGTEYSTGSGIFNASAGIRADPYKERTAEQNTYASIGISPVGSGQRQGFWLTASVGLNFNSDGVSSYGHVGVTSGGTNLLGASISSNGNGVRGSAFGASYSQLNNNAGKISTSGYGYRVTIPVYYQLNLTLGYSYVRYWSDERDFVNVYGSLHADNASSAISTVTANQNSFDSYCLNDPNAKIESRTYPQYQTGGSFPAFDSYSVMGQGIGGVMKPYLFETASLYRQNVAANGSIKSIVYKNITPFTKKAQFRFQNDFSNTNVGTIDPQGYNDTKNQLAGKSHIEWFTNNQIATGEARSKGFQPYKNVATGIFNGYVGEQAGGYMITNSSGVTYHYGLAVYAYGEYEKITSKDKPYTNSGNLPSRAISDIQAFGNLLAQSAWPIYNGVKVNNPLAFIWGNGGSGTSEPPESCRENVNLQPYAYTWLLTAVTGPDYVDRNASGLDDGDYGYWVKFHYGKWLSDYKWRTPYSGVKTDVDTRIQSFAYGSKEMYYLDAIETRSHVALFVKDVRKDAMSVGDCFGGSILPSAAPNTNIMNQEFPLMSLKLSKIKIYNKENFVKNNIHVNTIGAIGSASLYNHSFNYAPVWEPGPGSGPKPDDILRTITHNSKNVIMSDDLSNNPLWDSMVDKQIDFETDYSLCKNTENSVADFNTIYQKYPVSNNATKNGKLTLNKLVFKGRGGVENIPSMVFGYGANNPDYSKDKVDMWGNYKDDFNGSLLSSNENAAKVVSDFSAEYVDAWSLKEIKTPLGGSIKIEYESDDYNNVDLGNQSLFSIKKIVKNGSSAFVYLYDDGYDITKIYKQNDLIGLSFLVSAYYGSTTTTGCTGCSSDLNKFIAENKYIPKKVDRIPILSVNQAGGYIEIDISDPLIYGQLTKDYTKFIRYTGTCQQGQQCGITYHIADGTWPEIIGGGFVFSKMGLTKGGGLRVKGISVENLFSKTTNITRFAYSNGSTSYEPFGVLKAQAATQPSNGQPGYDRFTAFHNNLANSYGISSTTLFAEALQKDIQSFYNSVILNAREVPGPGIYYGNTTVSEYVKQSDGIERKLPGEKEYIYDVFNTTKPEQNDFKRPMFYYAQDQNFDYNNREVTIQDYSSRAGLLKKVITYESKPNKISEVDYTYLHDLGVNYLDPNVPYSQKATHINSLIGDQLRDRFFNQGLIHQSFIENKTVQGIGDQSVLSHRYEHPVVLVKTTNINYKNGFVSESENLKFDFYSGAVVKQVSKDSYGNAWLTETTPAYRASYTVNGSSIYPYSGMGLKVRDLSNKNMLEQEFQNQTYKVNYNEEEHTYTQLGLVSSSITTWSTGIPVMGIASDEQAYQNEIWRSCKNYSWLASPSDRLLPDGTHKLTDYKAFDLNPAHAIDARWLKTSEVTKIDPYSHVLEGIDVNNRSSAVKMDNKSMHVVTNASNAAFSELAYSGAESNSTTDIANGGVDNGTGIISTSAIHTGLSSLSVSGGSTGFKFVVDKLKANVDKSYRASVWVYMPGFSEDELNTVELVCKINNVQQALTGNAKPIVSKKAGSWYLLQTTVKPPVGNTHAIEFSCVNNNTLRSVYFDDFRVCPLKSEMTSYVYNPLTSELTHIIDNNNLYTRYIYNEDGKLVKIYKELFRATEKPVAEMKMNYGNK